MYIVDGSRWHWRRLTDGCTLQDPAAAFETYRKTHRKVYHSEKQAEAGKAAFVANLHYMVQENSKLSNPCVPAACRGSVGQLGPSARDAPGLRPRVPRTRPTGLRCNCQSYQNKCTACLSPDMPCRPRPQVSSGAEQVQRPQLRAVSGTSASLLGCRALPLDTRSAAIPHPLLEDSIESAARPAPVSLRRDQPTPELSRSDACSKRT